MMRSAFEALVSAPPSGRGTALIVDHQEYAREVILRGSPLPFGDVTQYGSFFDRAQALFRPDCALVDLGMIYANLHANDEELLALTSSRTHVGYALKTLLSDYATAAAALELVSVVARTATTPLVLQVPSPMRWLAQTHELCLGGSHTDISSDLGESMSMYFADWLRRFSSLPVALLLLDCRRADLPGLALDDPAEYTPILDVAYHYRWPVAQRNDYTIDVAGTDLKGVVVPREYWLTEHVAVPAGDFLLATIPREAAQAPVSSRVAELG
jgi:hypothetical protein